MNFAPAIMKSEEEARFRRETAGLWLAPLREQRQRERESGRDGRGGKVEKREKWKK